MAARILKSGLRRFSAGNLKDSQRTDTVKSIRFFTPELAAVDADTVITGTKTADGSEIPPRKGLMIVMMIKQNGRWFIGTFHEAEYPAPRGGAGAPASNSTIERGRALICTRWM